VVEFVRALALGWKNLAAYPPGHPVLSNSLGLIHRRLGELRGPAGDITFGVARDAILYGQERIDSSYAQKFGNALYTRGVALLRFDMNTDVEAIETFLRLLGAGTAADHKRALWEELTAAGVISIHLQPVDYSDVKVSDDLDAERPKTPAEELWEEILRAILEGHELTPEGQRLLNQKIKSTSELAALILQYVNNLERESEYDPNATFGVRFTARIDSADADQVAGRLGDSVGVFITGSSGAKREIAVQQAVELLKSLPDPMRAAVLRSVMRALAGDESAAALLRDFVANLPKDEVLETLRYLSSSMNLSTHAMRLVESLMQTSKPAMEAIPPSAEAVSNVIKLFGEDDIDRYNPDDHKELLDQVSIDIPESTAGAVGSIADLGDRVETIGSTAVNHQLARTLLALVRHQGPRRPPWAVLARLETVFLEELAVPRFHSALSIVRELQELAITATNPAFQDALHGFFDRVGQSETLKTLIDALHSMPEHGRDIEQLLEILGTAATRNLLMALAEESNRSRRRRILTFVSSLGSVIVPEVKPFLTDKRWFVVRNMLVLLRAIGDRSLLPEVRKIAAHPDIRVRLEAIRALMALELTPPVGLLEEAIGDPDPKVAEKAIILVGNYGIKEAVAPLMRIVDGNDVFGARRTLRLRALKALGDLAEPHALPRLQRFFTDSILPWPSREERRAAYESLAGYPASARAPFVARGLKSRDAYVRQVCEKIANTP
jgi:hypothetical protein